MVRTYLAMGVLSVALAGVAGCNREPEATSNPSPGNTVENLPGASTQPEVPTTLNAPGVPASDAAAERLIDNAKSSLKAGDVSKAKSVVEELKQPGMYDKLSAQVKTQVDALEKTVNSTPAVPGE